MTVAILKENKEKSSYDIEIKSNASKTEMEQAENGDIKDNSLYCPIAKPTPITVRRIESLKRTVQYGLRRWSP